MNAKSNGKSRITAILTAILALLACMAFAAPAALYADGDSGSGAPETSAHDCGEFCREKLYYFSDSADSEFYMNTFMREYVDTYKAIHGDKYKGFYWYDLKSIGADGEDGYVPERFGRSMYELGLTSYDYTYSNAVSAYTGVKDALVIYEVRELFPIHVLSQSGNRYVVSDFLLDIFGAMKENNCRIMLVCGTDEALYTDIDNNDFLDCVDFHVNTDLYTYFTNSVYSQMRACGFERSTIILDKNMSQYVLDDDYYNDYRPNSIRISDKGNNEGYLLDRYNFLDSYLVPMLRVRYGYPIYEKKYENNLLVYEKLKMNVLCHLGGDRFFDLRGQIYINSEEAVAKFDNNDYFYNRVYFIGTTRLSERFELYDWTLELKNRLGMDDDCFRRYMFIENGGLFDWETDDALYVYGRSGNSIADYMKPMLYDFILGEDVTQYDNWEGRCVVTSKPFAEGESWVENFGEGRFMCPVEEEMNRYLFNLF